MKNKYFFRIITAAIFLIVFIYNNAVAQCPTIGDTYGGGKVAYVLQSGDPGYEVGKCKGIIVTTIDQSTSASWGCSGTLVGASATALGTGASNTTTIVGGCATAGIAARLCNDLDFGGYTDWYLPSKDELNKLYIYRTSIGMGSTNVYWSSSESSATDAFTQSFINGVQMPDTKGANSVRAIRSFEIICPTITSQPTNSSICVNGSTNFTVSATGDGLTYKWQYFNGSSWGNVVNGTPSGSVYSGQTTAAFSVSSISTIGSFQYRCNVSGTCGTPVNSNTATLTQDPANTSTLTSGAGSDNQTVTEGTAIANITYSTTGATGIGTPTGLPTGVTASWTSNVLNIFGTPTATGTFNYSIPLTGGCGSVNATGTITVTANPCGALAIGNTYGGGKIAYILQNGDPGYEAGKCKGLIAAPSDQSTGAQWGCYGTAIAGTSTGFGTGAANTSLILAGCPETNRAARICHNLMLNDYHDWYLPSIEELDKLYINKTAIGGFASNKYWSSSENDADNAWLQDFNNGSQYYYNKSNTFYVRAVRAFQLFNNLTIINSGQSTICQGDSTTLTAQWGADTYTYNWSNSATTPSITVSPSVTTTYTVTATDPLSNSETASVVITVNPTNTATLTSGAGSDNQTVTEGNAITTITYSTISATGIGTPTGLPTGVTASWTSNVITVSGTPTATGTFNYSIPLTGGCGSVSATGAIRVNSAGPCGAILIGDTYAGGKVAYILQNGDPGYEAGKCKGLIAPPSNQSTGAQWGCLGTAIGGTSTALGTGAANTAAIVAGCAETNRAARICQNLMLNNYHDWYLPSKDELNKLYLNRTAIGGFASNTYWSSSEHDANIAWYQDFSNGIQGGLFNRSSSNYVRAVRAFQLFNNLTIINSGPSSICTGSGDSTTLTAQWGSDAYTYVWSNSATTPSITVSPSVTTTYTVTATDPLSNSETASVVITVHAYPGPTASSNSPVLEGTALTLTGGPGSMTSYAWSGPNSYTNTTQSPTVSASATLSMAGSYTLTVTDANGCTGTASTAVTVNANPCSGTSSVSDNDGNTYNTVAIGTQCWFAKNLATTKYRTGQAIENVTDNTAWQNNTTGAYAWYSNNISNKPTYGALYNWHAATNGSKLCPPGWKIPEDSEFNLLLQIGNTPEDSYTALANGGSSGFNAQAGGYRYWNDGIFYNINNFGNNWSKTVDIDSSAFTLYIDVGTGSAGLGDMNHMRMGNSVRCLKDNSTFSNLNITGNFEICSGSSTTLTAEPGATATYAWSNSATTNAITVSPTVTTTYTVTVTNGGDTESISVVVKVNPTNAANLTSGAGSDNQTLTEGNAITTITYATTGATGIVPTGLPIGVTASWTSNVITISGTPSETGTFNYSIPLTGGCGSVNATGTITVNPSGPWSCGQSFSVTHTVGAVAPEAKTVNYGTVQTSLSGASKCWITQNLGASQQASAANDATEASAGWYWQFNRKQGYKNAGTVIPSWTITDIDEASNWILDEDPCNLLLGNGWRIPTYSEWSTADGSWSNSGNAFNSVLKLHDAGYLNRYTGAIEERGNAGKYWSSWQASSLQGHFLDMGSSWSLMTNDYKPHGYSIRCIQDACTLPPVPTTATHTATHNQITWNWNTVVDATGYKWNTTDNIGTANDLGNLTTYTQTSLASSTNYTLYVWSYNACGLSNSVLMLSHTTLADPCNGVALVTDIDNNNYDVVAIGEQCWLKQNLKTTKFRTGHTIPNVTDAGNWGGLSKGAYVWYANTAANKDTYGALYNWYATVDANEICPTGWRVPTNAEWTTLINNVSANNANWCGGISTQIGKALAATALWETDANACNVGNDLVSNNLTGFTALPAGYRNNDGTFGHLTQHGYWWTNTQYSANEANRYIMHSYSPSIYQGVNLKQLGLSVRCLRDPSSVCPTPSIPTTGMHTPAQTEILWTWNKTPLGVSYKYNTVNDFSGATDLGPDTSFTQISLNPATPYTLYVWAYNACGNSQELVLSSTTLSDPCGGLTTVPDIDNNAYDVVAIGEQCWLKQNLKTTKFRTGKPLQNVTDGTAWSTLDKPAYVWYNNDFSTNGNTYGALYNWHTTVNPHEICPTGWRVPTKNEWDILANYLSASSTYWCGGQSANIAKAVAAQTNWATDVTTCAVGNNLSANNASNFTGLPAGGRSGSGVFDGITQTTNWWSSTPLDATFSWGRTLHYEIETFDPFQGSKQIGASIRCLRDVTSVCPLPTTPGTITGSATLCPNQTGQSYSISSVPYAVTYNWTVPTGWTIATGQGDTTITVIAGTAGQNGDIAVTAQNACGNSSTTTLSVTVSQLPTPPQEGAHTPSAFGIIWHWNPVAGATGYKYNTSNDYLTATDIGVSTAYTQGALSCGNTPYTLYVWAYNNCGESAGTELSASTSACPAPYCDTQEWTYANINVGSRINASVSQTNNSTLEKYCYNDVEANCDIYGGLYLWGEAMQYAASVNCDPCGPTVGAGGVQGICPTGYHIPSDLEWSRYEWCIENSISPTGSTSLSNFQTLTGWRGSSTSGYGPADKMKVTNANNPVWDGTNTSGFAAMPAGFRNTSGSFGSLNTEAAFWSATESSTDAFMRTLTSGDSRSKRQANDKLFGYSVRCIKDTCLTPPAVITSQPVDNSICEWENASLSASATGTALSYQWQVSTDGGTAWSNLTNGGVYSNVGTTSLSITAAPANMDGYKYRCAVSTLCGQPTLTNTVTLTINGAPDITWQPINTNVCDSAAATISVQASGSNLAYQWQVSTTGGTSWTNLTNTAPYSGANATDLSIDPVTSAVDGNMYRVYIEGSCPPSILSNQITLGIASFNAITLASSPSTTNQQACINTPITPILYDIVGATNANFLNLPPGVTGNVIGSQININGFPTTAGIYNYTVELVGGCGTASESGTIEVISQPQAPFALAADNIVSTGFTAKWNPVQGATGFRLDVSTNGSFTSMVTGYNDLDVGMVTSYDVTGLSCAFTYFYRVRAVKNVCTSNSSFSILVNTANCACPTVGQSLDGGIVAYVFQPGDNGYIVNQCVSLIAAESDLSSAEWGCMSSLIGTSADLGDGYDNTVAIDLGCADVGIAAKLCNDLSLNGYDDWFLPSKEELNKLFIEKTTIGGFSTSDYWTSSEDDDANAWVQNFGTGSQSAAAKNTVKAVRPVRYYTPPPPPGLASDTVCYRDSLVYVIPPVMGSTGYEWEFSGPYEILAPNDTACNLIPLGDGILTVKALNNCGESVERVLEVIVYHYGALEWNGQEDNNWFNANNWNEPISSSLKSSTLNCNIRIPGPNTYVTILDAPPYQPVIDYAERVMFNGEYIDSVATCGSIHIDEDDTLFFRITDPANPSHLYVNGDFKLDGLVLVEDENALIILECDTGEIIFSPLAKSGEFCRSCDFLVTGEEVKIVDNNAHARSVTIDDNGSLILDDNLSLDVFNMDVLAGTMFKLNTDAELKIAGQLNIEGDFTVDNGTVYYNNGNDMWDSLSVSQIIVPATYNILKANGGNVDSTKTLYIGDGVDDVIAKTLQLLNMPYVTEVETQSEIKLLGDGSLIIANDELRERMTINLNNRIYDPSVSTTFEMGNISGTEINIFYTSTDNYAIHVVDYDDSQTMEFYGAVNYKGSDVMLLIPNTYYKLGVDGFGANVKMLDDAFVNNQLNLNVGRLDLNSNTITIENENTDAITYVIGYIYAEDVPPYQGQIGDSVLTQMDNIVKWKIKGSDVGTFEVPFGNDEDLLIPFSLEVDNNDMSDTEGFVKFSTYGTPSNTSPGYGHNLPRPPGVDHLGYYNDGGLIVDRYWYIEFNEDGMKSGANSPVRGNLSFSYIKSELDGVVESGMMAQRFNPVGDSGWGVWADVLFTMNPLTAMPVYGGSSIDTINPPLGTGRFRTSLVDETQFFNVWVLTNETSPLPINLLAFEGTCYSDKIIINWATATEINNSHFTLERSRDGVSWTKVADVNGNGTTSTQHNYSVTDNYAFTGISYYRLSQTDFDGNVKVLGVTVVNCQIDKQAGLFIYPNPFADNITINFVNLPATNAHLYIYDALGRVVISRAINNIESGQGTIVLNLRHLANGVYNIKFVAEEFIRVEKITKQL